MLLIDVNVLVYAHRKDVSGHADYQEILAWLLGFNKKPERIFLVHGEDGPREALANHIRKQFNWNVTVPKEGESVELDF